jgi:hypothetical protein
MAIVAPQPLNMADRLAARQNIVGRCTAVVANYALYILGEAANTANHANRKSWADDAIRNAQSFGERVSWHVLNQPSFLNGGSSIEDAELAGVVETAVNTHFVAPLT